MRLALMQCEPVSGVAAGLAGLRMAAGGAAAESADILITPEMFLTGYDIGPEAVQAAAEPLDGPTMAEVAAIAREAEIAIVAGLPLLEDGRVFNAAVFVDRSGETRTVYRKTHLYGDVDRSQFAAGDALPTVFRQGEWNIALAICYDIEFPELARSVALGGADLILVPTANMDPYESVATRVVPVRAEENGVFIAYANYCGSEGRFTYCGLSCVVDPAGNTLARAGRAPEFVLADIDRASLAVAHARTPYLSDRRTDLYGPGR